MNTVLLIVGYVVLVIVTMKVWVNSAPRGYEDETGFHYGEEPNDPLKK